MDSNLSRARARERWMENKLAFDDIIGDPFAWPEPVIGQYHKLKSRSSVMAIKNSDEGRATLNPARPNVIDFFCDVEHAIESVLSPEELYKFVDTYITESTETAFTPQERSKIEQRVGKIFRQRKLAPVARYFTAMRMRISKNVHQGQNQACKNSYTPFRTATIQSRGWGRYSDQRRDKDSPTEVWYYRS